MEYKDAYQYNIETFIKNTRELPDWIKDAIDKGSIFLNEKGSLVVTDGWARQYVSEGDYLVLSLDGEIVVVYQDTFKKYFTLYAEELRKYRRKDSDIEAALWTGNNEDAVREIIGADWVSANVPTGQYIIKDYYGNIKWQSKDIFESLYTEK